MYFFDRNARYSKTYCNPKYPNNVCNDIFFYREYSKVLNKRVGANKRLLPDILLREDVRGVAGVAAATPFFHVLFHKLGPKI